MNFKSNKVAKTIIAVICLCRRGVLDDVKSVAASTVASLFSGLQEGARIDLRIELSSLVAVGIGKCFPVVENLLEKGYEHKYLLSL